MFVVMRGCCGAWLPRCVVAAVIAGTGVRAVPAPGSGCVWVVPACVGFEAGTAGGPAARRCAYFVGRRGGGPVCWGSGFCFGRAGVCSVCGVCFVSLESASVFRCSLHAFAARAQVVCIFIRGRFRHASFLRETQMCHMMFSCIIPTRSIVIPDNASSRIMRHAMFTVGCSRFLTTLPKILFFCSLYWKLYLVTPIPNPESPVGYVETLQEIYVNETLSTWNATTLHIPARTYDYGIYKAVFRFGVR